MFKVWSKCSSLFHKKSTSNFENKIFREIIPLYYLTIEVYHEISGLVCMFDVQLGLVVILKYLSIRVLDWARIKDFVGCGILKLMFQSHTRSFIFF